MAIKYNEIGWTLDERPGEVPEIHCPVCNGRGCACCEDRGTCALPAEPGLFSLNAWPVLRVAEMWRKGTPPEAGGLMDQPAALMDAVRFVWSDEDHLRAEKMGPMMAMMTQ